MFDWFLAFLFAALLVACMLAFIKFAFWMYM
jgi:hypothetical protein